MLTPVYHFLAFIVDMREFGVEEGDGPAETVLQKGEREERAREISNACRRRVEREEKQGDERTQGVGLM